MNYGRRSTIADSVLAVASPRRIGALAGGLMLVMIVVATVQTLREQLALLPPRPPSPAESAAARPAAEGAWAQVAARLQARFPDRPLETGEVWSMRTGRICGFVNARASNTDNMTRFYTTADGLPHIQADDAYAITQVWPACLDDRWVVLHDGLEQTGLCASAHGRTSRLARDYLCVDWTPQ